MGPDPAAGVLTRRLGHRQRDDTVKTQDGDGRSQAQERGSGRLPRGSRPAGLRDLRRVCVSCRPGSLVTVAQVAGTLPDVRPAHGGPGVFKTRVQSGAHSAIPPGHGDHGRPLRLPSSHAKSITCNVFPCPSGPETRCPRGTAQPSLAQTLLSPRSCWGCRQPSSHGCTARNQTATPADRGPAGLGGSSLFGRRGSCRAGAARTSAALSACWGLSVHIRETGGPRGPRHAAGPYMGRLFSVTG